MALAFGKNPEIVTWARLEKITSVSPFAKKFAQVHELARRAKQWGQLYDPVLPGIFLAWASKLKIEIPEELVEQVEKLGILEADWKDMFDKKKVQHDELLAKMKRTITNHEQLKFENDQLKMEIRERSDIVNKGLHDSERNSLLKLVYGMAIIGFDYKPGSNRNPATGSKARSIAAKLDNLGLKMHPDTVRKYIKEADELFVDLIPEVNSH